MDSKNEEKLVFTLDDGMNVYIDAFVMETAREDSALSGIEESEDETVSRHLRKVTRLWPESTEPHFVLPHIQSRSGSLPPYVVTAWLSRVAETIVVVFFVDTHPEKTIGELFEMYLHQVNWKVLVAIDEKDREEERKWFDWYQEN